MKFSRIVFFLALASLSAIYARITQLLYLTEEKTGFFLPDNKTVAIALSAFIMVVICAAAIMTCFTRRNPAGAPDKSLLSRIGAAVLAVACLYEAIFVNYLSGATMVILLTRLSAVAASAALSLYVARFYVPAAQKLHKLFYLPILVFFVMKLICTFTVYATVSVIADNVFHIAFMCFALIFMLTLLKLENGIMFGRSAYRLFPLAAITFILGTCCSIPQAVLLVLGKSALVHIETDSLLLPAATAFFAMSYTLALYGKKNIVRRKRNTPKLESNTSYHEMSGQFVSGGGKHRKK